MIQSKPGTIRNTRNSRTTRTNKIGRNTRKLISYKSTDRPQTYIIIDKLPILLVELPILLVETVNNSIFKDMRRDNTFYQTYEDATTMEIIPYPEQLKIYLETGLYKTALKYSTSLETATNTSVYLDGISIQDISYVKQFADSLSGNVPNYICDLADIP